MRNLSSLPSTRAQNLPFTTDLAFQACTEYSLHMMIDILASQTTTLIGSSLWKKQVWTNQIERRSLSEILLSHASRFCWSLLLWQSAWRKLDARKDGYKRQRQIWNTRKKACALIREQKSLTLRSFPSSNSSRPIIECFELMIFETDQY